MKVFYILCSYTKKKFKFKTDLLLSHAYLFITMFKQFTLAKKGCNAGALHSIAPSLTEKLKTLKDIAESHGDV